ncbi:MAG: Hsp20/alpha crystallin family protein [Mycobacteriales bacterium]
MLRFDPFRDVDRLAEQMMSSWEGPRSFPMDVLRSGDHYVVHFDLPGVDPGSIDLHAEDNTLTVEASRSTRVDQDGEALIMERPTGTFRRQLVLGDGLDTDSISATYDEGVLTVTIPVHEKAKPRKIDIARAGSPKVIEGDAEQNAVGAST